MWPRGNFNNVDLVLLLLVVPSVLFYISFLILIAKKINLHPFNSSFFKLSLFLGVVDCAKLIKEYPTYKALQWGYFTAFFLGTKVQFLPRLLRTTGFFLGYCQHLMATVIAINRYCAMKFPVSVEEVDCFVLNIRQFATHFHLKKFHARNVKPKAID